MTQLTPLEGQGQTERWAVAVDIGGTFTDVVAVGETSGRRVDGKVLTTPADPVKGIYDALALIAHRGVEIPDCDYFVHATTLAINTLIERRGARVAMLATEGFRDVIESGRERRYDLYDLQISLHEPLVSRDLRFGVEERRNARGEVLKPLDEAGVRSAIERMEGVESVVVCFLHSYADDEHERQAAALVAEQLPGVYVCTSAGVAPIMREYERFILATVNAYIAPRVSYYLRELSGSLSARGFEGTIGIVKSDGGMCTVEEASERPVRILESGPAAGILSAADTASRCGEPLALAFDMGGTTAKACVIDHGVAVSTNELQVARLKRFVSGSGIPLRIASLDVIEIGAGGGSIAAIDELGILQVGPESSGADPGPACYGRGGAHPTVTDADLALGYLDATWFAGGTMELHPEQSGVVLREHILAPTGTADETLAAWAVHDVVNENMARAARRHCLEHGIDPRAVTVVATGGAGPVHAAAVAEKLGTPRVIFPPSPGVASAWGLLLAPRSAESVVASICAVESLSDGDLALRLDEIERALRERYPGDFAASAQVDMRLAGQQYEIPVEVPADRALAGLHRSFEREYEQRFGRPPWSKKREIVNWIVRLTQPRNVTRSPLGEERGGGSELGGTRRAYFGPAHGWIETPVTHRVRLQGEEERLGPMILNEEDTTVVVPPGYSVRCDDEGNVHITAVGAATGADTMQSYEVTQR